MDGLKLKLETAYKAAGGRQVNLISHSMGGILVMCFMTLYPDVRTSSLGDYLDHLSVFYQSLNHMYNLSAEISSV